MPEKERSIKDFKQLISLLKEKHICKRAVVVWSEDSHTQEAVSLAAHEGFIKPILICSETTRNTFAQKEGFETIIVDSPEEASRKAVALIREKQADIIMKGFVNTDVLLRAILDKELGILPKGAVLTHIAVAKLAEYNKLILMLL